MIFILILSLHLLITLMYIGVSITLSDKFILYTDVIINILQGIHLYKINILYK